MYIVSTIIDIDQFRLMKHCLQTISVGVKMSLHAMRDADKTPFKKSSATNYKDIIAWV
jgi:hypothetical protein